MSDSKRNIYTILGLVIVTALFVFFAVKSNRVSTPIPQNDTSVYPTDKIPRTSIIYFNPETINDFANKIFRGSIYLSTGDTEITGVQLEIIYDPKVISNIKLSPPGNSPQANSLFGNSQNYIVLLNKINETEGKISYSIAILPNGSPIKGAGSIGEVSFSSVGNKKGTTKIYFDKGTMVLTNNETQSVLKRVVPLTVHFE